MNLLRSFGAYSHKILLLIDVILHSNQNETKSLATAESEK